MAIAEKKYTVMLPTSLVLKAKETSGLTLTAALTRGLQLVERENNFEIVRRARGRIPFSLRVNKLRDQD